MYVWGWYVGSLLVSSAQSFARFSSHVHAELFIPCAFLRHSHSAYLKFKQVQEDSIKITRANNRPAMISSMAVAVAAPLMATNRSFSSGRFDNVS